MLLGMKLGEVVAKAHEETCFRIPACNFNSVILETFYVFTRTIDR